jgi:MoaA/NifB/PqqE/SkfB family radical SAM enzyme
VELLNNTGIDALNTERFKSIRRDMLTGIRVPECKKCYNEEENNKISYRQESNSLYLNSSVETFTENFNETYSIEISLDNICNLQCRMCSSQFSTKLILRDKLLNYKVYKKLESDYSFLELLDISKLKKIKILGGEPVMSPNFEKFLDYIIDRSTPENIIVHLVTNGTHEITPVLIKRLEKFKTVHLAVSLDAYDTANDYQRYGSSYITIWNNANTYRKFLKNATVGFHTVVCLYNANVLHKTLKKFDENDFGYSTDFVYNQEMSIEHAPDDYAEWLIKRNTGHSAAQQIIENMLKRRKYDKERWSVFLSNTKKLDNYYKVSLKDYNVDLYNFLNKQYGY